MITSVLSRLFTFTQVRWPGVYRPDVPLTTKPSIPTARYVVNPAAAYSASVVIGTTAPAAPTGH